MRWRDVTLIAGLGIGLAAPAYAAEIGPRGTDPYDQSIEKRGTVSLKLLMP